MESELVVSSSAVGEANFHLQFTPAYRRGIFADPLVRELTLGYVLMKLKHFKIVLLGYGFGPDHFHLFLGNVRSVGEIELVRQIKGFSSYMMRRGHRYLFQDKLWGDKFWSEGHFYRSCGAVNNESMKWYVEEGQKKHWKQFTYEQYCVMKNQKVLTDFAAA